MHTIMLEASDWWWTARDHGKGTDGRRSAVSPVVSFPPSFARTCSSRERRLGARQYQGCLTAKFEECDINGNLLKIQYFLDLISALGFVAFLIDIFPYCFATQKSTNNNNNNNKTSRSSLVLRNGLNCLVWTVKKIVSNFSWKKDSDSYKSEKRIQPYKEWICNCKWKYVALKIWLTKLVHPSSHAQHSSQEHDFFRGTLQGQQMSNIIIRINQLNEVYFNTIQTGLLFCFLWPVVGWGFQTSKPLMIRSPKLHRILYPPFPVPMPNLIDTMR